MLIITVNVTEILGIILLDVHSTFKMKEWRGFNQDNLGNKQHNILKHG